MKKRRMLSILVSFVIGASLASCAMPETSTDKASPAGETELNEIDRGTPLSDNEKDNSSAPEKDTTKKTTAKKKKAKGSSEKKKTAASKTTTKKQTTTTPKPTTTTTTTTRVTTTTTAYNSFNGKYILNTNTLKYHTNPNCRGVHDMKPENKQESDYVPEGYQWCKWCQGG